MYKMKLSTGRELSAVEQNGVMLSTAEEISREELVAGLGHVVITGKPDDVSDGELAGSMDMSWEYFGMELKYYRDGGTLREFVIVPMSDEEMSRMRDRADLEYVAMMSGIQL